MVKAIRKWWPVFVLPTLLCFIIGFVVPFAEGLYLSFCKFTTVTKAEFVGIVADNVDTFSKFQGTKQFTFPLAIDNDLSTINLYMRNFDQVPMIAIINEKGLLVWRGNPRAAIMVLPQVIEGKYNLKEYLRKENLDTSNRSRMIHLFETTSPYYFIHSKYKTGNPTSSDLSIISYLLIDLKLKPGVAHTATQL